MLLLVLAAAARAAEIRVVGSDLLGPAFGQAATDLPRRRPSQPLMLELHGTRLGIEALTNGSAAVGLLLLPDGEKPPGDTLTARVVAWHVTVVAAPAAASVEKISLSELRALFSSPPGPVTASSGPLLAVAPDASPAWAHFRHRVLGRGQETLSVRWQENDARLADALRATARGLAIADAGIAREPGLKLLALSAGPAGPAFPPTTEHVNSGQYPLRMPLWVVFRRSDTPRVLPFLKFLLGDEAAQALAGAGFMALPAGDRARLADEFEEMR